MATELKVNEIDKLFNLITEYRQSDNYRALLKYISGFKNLSPYNAFLVAQQRPGSRYVLTPEEWKREGRDISLNTRPLVILRPFGPVQFVYDVSDTVISDGKERTLFDDIEDVIERLSAPYRTYGNEPKNEFDILKYNVKMYGIQIREFNTGSEFAAQIEFLNESRRKIDNCLAINLDRKVLKWPADYLISIRSKANCGEAFASCCHELGHLFCGHVQKPNWLKSSPYRSLSHAEKEFEAESASWLVCNHFEIDNPSERYLANYVSSSEK